MFEIRKNGWVDAKQKLKLWPGEDVSLLRFKPGGIKELRTKIAVVEPYLEYEKVL